ncbi:hypothetical protein LTR67_004417 [Exophiala xenobiotica]
MSLYYDAATVLTSGPQDGSLRSRLYGNKLNLKSKPAHLYALISETVKFNHFVKEIIDNATFLTEEPKLTPILSLLLVHDHCLAKGGIAAPAGHPLRQAIERHKARLQAEFTKARLRRKCATLDALKECLLRENPPTQRSQPRWIRVNTLKSRLADQLATTFKGYRSDATLAEVAQSPATVKVLAIDQTIPDVLALPPDADFTKSPAYKNGEIILQDKASCFPAYLLAGSLEERATMRDCMDGCAAPGNKTSHLATFIVETDHPGGIYACERDRRRSQVLKTMMDKSGAQNVTVLAEQDFLSIDPQDVRFKNITHLLLDPSCSGSGIVGREDIPTLALPEDPKAQKSRIASTTRTSKKRKRDQAESKVEVSSTEPLDAEETKDISVDQTRLQKLAALQTRIVEHALAFPAALRVTYSTCSVHVEENEGVVSRVLSSEVAKSRGWRVLWRREQVAGLRNWRHRGIPNFITDRDEGSTLTQEELEACIRCYPEDDEGTMGFFVCAFARPSQHEGQVVEHASQASESWEGFAD